LPVGRPGRKCMLRIRVPTKAKMPESNLKPIKNMDGKVLFVGTEKQWRVQAKKRDRQFSVRVL
jgi:hypothetical protein